MTKPLVEMKNIVKRWGAVEALSGVSLSVDSGEVVALLGDNGAGKSTLIKILSGAEIPTSGQIFVGSKEVSIKTTRDAIALGIETIYQDSALVEQLSISRNMFLGREPIKSYGPIRFLDQDYMTKSSEELLRRVGISKHLDPKKPISSLSGGERQSIAIARAMFFKSDLVVLDEPTNNLGLDETRGVMRFLGEVKSSGKASILITHNLHHVMDVADRAVILRRGKCVGNVLVKDTNVEHLSAIITGEVTA